MASHLPLHLAAPPPLLLPHRRRLHLPRLPRPPAAGPSLNPARAPLLPLPRRLVSRGRAVGGGAEDGAGAGAGLAEGEGEEEAGGAGGGLVGEDSAAFRLGDQSVALWAYFAVILAAVLWALNVLWIDPGTGVGTKFLDAVASVSDSHEVSVFYLLLQFWYL